MEHFDSGEMLPAVLRVVKSDVRQRFVILAR